MMLRKRLRKLLRRLVIWALVDNEPVTLVNWDINTGKNRFDAGIRRVIINTIRQAKINREL